MKTSDNHPQGLPAPWETPQPVTIERQLLLAQFACATLTGFLADPNVPGNYKASAEAAFRYADEMLAELDRREAR